MDLIVTADDFGAAVAVNEAVEIAHRDGVLTAASLMVAGAAAADAVERARRMPSLRVGLHLVLVDGRPILPPSAVPDLVDASGFFRTDMVGAGFAMAFSRTVRRQLAAEVASQFYAFAATGLTLDHVNAHKHFHLHPTISGLILEIGARYGLRAVRAPVEPADVLRLAEPGAKPGGAAAATFWASALQGRLRRAGLTAPDQVFGLRWSGAMTGARLRGIIENLPGGLSEIYLHPAVAGGFEGSVAGYRYRAELDGLVSPEVIEAARASAARLGGFADFAAVPA